MSIVRAFLRRWLGVHEPALREGQDVSRGLLSVNRQLTQLRGLLHQQADFTVEALRRAGWQDDQDVAQQEALERALAAVRTRRRRPRWPLDRRGRVRAAVLDSLSRMARRARAWRASNGGGVQGRDRCPGIVT